MKRLFYALGCITLVLTGALSFFHQQPMPVATSVVGQAFLESSFVLHYSQLPPTKLASFVPSDGHLKKSTIDYTALTDTYLPKPHYEELISQASAYYKTHDLNLPAYFYQGIHQGNWQVLSFVGDLSSILIQNLASEHTYPLTFKKEQNLGQMYPYHLQITDNTLTILGGKVNSYDSMLYTIDLPTGNVQTAYNVANAKSALTASQTALIEPSFGILIEGQGLRTIDAITGDSRHIPLDFIPLGITYSKTHLLVYGTPTGGQLPYSYLDHTLSPLASGQLPLPSASPHLIQAFLNDNTVTFFTAESDQSFYQNYSLTYSLSAGQLINCIGLESPNQYFLMGISKIDRST